MSRPSANASIADIVSPQAARSTIADILAVVPRERETQAAIEVFQRQVQPHHNVAQQVEILSRTVMKPLDARAEEHVRAAVLRAFGITAISPTALSDALFFLAVGVRMVRRIAATYGHRPTTAATVHLLRRLVIEAGKLGVIDIASTSIAQQLGGAVAERLATTAADSFYASYRMARLGVIVMDMCRPIPFRDDEVPQHHLDGDQRDPAAERAGAAGLTRQPAASRPDMVYQTSTPRRDLGGSLQQSWKQL